MHYIVSICSEPPGAAGRLPRRATCTGSGVYKPAARTAPASKPSTKNRTGIASPQKITANRQPLKPCGPRRSSYVWFLVLLLLGFIEPKSTTNHLQMSACKRLRRLACRREAFVPALCVKPLAIAIQPADQLLMPAGCVEQDGQSQRHAQKE